MNFRLESPVLALEAGQVLALDGARGTRIQPREGTLWITLEGEARDFIVGAGETFAVPRGGRTVVQAMSPARVALREAGGHDPSGEPLAEERLMEARYRAQRLLGV